MLTEIERREIKHEIQRELDRYCFGLTLACHLDDDGGMRWEVERQVQGHAHAPPEGATEPRMLHVVARADTEGGREEAVAIVRITDQPTGIDMLSHRQILDIEAVLMEIAGGEAAGIKQVRLLNWTWLRADDERAS